MPLLDWDERQTEIARLALSQLSYATDTGAERGEIAAMLADLNGGGTMRGPSPQYRYEHYDPR